MKGVTPNSFKRTWENDSHSGRLGDDSNDDSLLMVDLSSIIIHQSSSVVLHMEQPHEQMGSSGAIALDERAHHVVVYVEVGLCEQAH